MNIEMIDMIIRMVWIMKTNFRPTGACQANLPLDDCKSANRVNFIFSFCIVTKRYCDNEIKKISICPLVDLACRVSEL